MWSLWTVLQLTIAGTLIGAWFCICVMVDLTKLDAEGLRRRFRWLLDWWVDDSARITISLQDVAEFVQAGGLRRGPGGAAFCLTLADIDLERPSPAGAGAEPA